MEKLADLQLLVLKLLIQKMLLLMHGILRERHLFIRLQYLSAFERHRA